MAKGAAGLSGCSRLYASSAVVISISHSSSCSAGRAFKDGMEPMTPAMHWAISILGLLTIKRGAAITGKLPSAKCLRRTSGRC